MSRTGKSAINSLVGLSCTILSSLLSFFLRGAFIRLLGLEYAGINSLFADILKLLNLADLGVTNAILVRLYRSCAHNNDEETELYLTIYKRICYLMAAVITIGGLACTPFLKYLVKKQPSFPEPLWALFLIVLATGFVGHAWTYKATIFTAKQERYISTIIQYCCLFLQHGLQLLAIFLYKNIYLYLCVPLVMVALRYSISGFISKRRYRIRYQTEQKLSREERRELFKDVGSLSVYKLCRTLDVTVATMLISRFVSVAVTGIYGSVNMLFGALDELLGVFNDGMLASIGDLHAQGEKKRLENVFYQSFHFTYLLFGICAATLAPFLKDFVQLWIRHTLEVECFYVMIVNFVMYGFGMNVATFRNAMGIFQKGWLRPAFTAGLNILFSLVLVIKIGLLGTLLGTTLARLLTLVWYDPYLVCRHGLSCMPYKYYFRYVCYIMFIGVIAGALVVLRQNLPPVDSFFSAIWHGVFYFSCATAGLVSFGCLMPEQKSIFRRVLGMVKTSPA